jgi:formamidopyrimidine-DNA glycosylase
VPELPEVEAVRQTLSQKIPTGSSLDECSFARKDLRFPIPIHQIKSLEGSTLSRIERRGKYLLFVFSQGILISHLGMTGHWRVEVDLPKTPASTRKHDHVRLNFGGLVMIYNDPRRFGYLQFVRKAGELSQHPLLRELGLEPLSEEFNTDYLAQRSQHSARAVKIFLMDQSVVVGVGNIYASEVLFRARVRPQKKAQSLRREQWQRIVEATRIILQTAIDSGGSSIRDYRTVDGAAGGAQLLHQVYGKKGEPCPVCATPIRSAVLGGRATYWCPNCQKG